MKYQPPAGKLGDAPYENGNLTAGLRGDIPPAAAIEHPMREIVHVIEFAGLTPAGDDLEQLRKAIVAIVDSMSGGGAPVNYLTLNQAAARLPIFPEVSAADGKINVYAPGGGSILVPAGVGIMHRGIAPYNTSDYAAPARTFVTAANRTYHLRWTPSGGFALRDLADPAYNPAVQAESSVVFDSAFDDMLVSRIVTNGLNEATITNLRNRTRLFHEVSFERTLGNSVSWAPLEDTAVTLNWARTPRFGQPLLRGLRSYGVNQGPAWGAGYGMLGMVYLRHAASSATRYGHPSIEYMYDDSSRNAGSAIIVEQFVAE